MRTATIKPTADQFKFHSLECKYPAFIGGFGVGKSETMANQAFMDASHSSSALIGLYEPTYDLVRLIMAPRMEEKLSAYGVRYKYNKSENIIYTGSSGFGDFILRTLDNPSRIIGYETYRSHIDELDTLKTAHAQEAWNKIIARNRQSPKGLDDPFNRASVYTTPEGFRFVHKRWAVDGGKDYDYVQASTLSNPFLPSDYVQSLRDTYPAGLIDAYINGLFVNLTSGTVYNSFSRTANHSDEEMKQKEPLLIGQDFNVTNMCSVIYVKRGNDFIAVDELHGIYDTPSLIKTIKERYSEHHITIYPDASGDSRKTVNASTSDIALLKQAGFTVKVRSKNPFVKDRIMSMNSALDKRSMLVNTDRCPEYTRCLEQQAYDKNGEPDKSAGFDHMNDAGGYVISYEMPIRKPVGSINVRFGA